MPSSLDGSLVDWPDIADAFLGGTLLLGNGLSINVWPAFAYRSLFDYAAGGGLTPEDLALFDATPNFERVLSELNTAIRVNQVAGVDHAPLYEHYLRIQAALGHAIRQVHPHRMDIPDTTLGSIREHLIEYEWIFTTSYDLILYWAMGYGERFTPFVDLFKYGGRLEFHPGRATIMAHKIPVFFLHGALHLVVGSTGVTWKIRRSALQTLLDQFGQPNAEDPQARPLLVTEGSARDKLRAIEANDYLSDALGLLREVDLPLVIFGSSLGQEDQHLVDVLNEHPGRAIAISMQPGTRQVLRTRQGTYGRLAAEELVFFNSTTHPLGDPQLCARP